MNPLSKPDRQLDGAHHVAIGDIVVSVINDGIHQVSFDDLVADDRAACEQAHLAEFRSAPPWLTINCFVIRSGGKLALVDAGFGPKTPFVGGLLRNLSAIGIGPEDVDVILMTHMHPDHEAGLIDADGKAIFPKAELVLHEDELAFWRDDSAMSRASEAGKGDFALARTALSAYDNRLRTVTASEVLPGVRSMPTPGHTPGHTAWLIESSGDGLLLWGDIIHFPGIQFAIPDATVAFDIDGPAAAAGRKEALAFSAAEKIRVGGIHLDYPALGHVVSENSGYRFVPEIWQPVV